jgi:signal transduction histidine kinase
MAERLKADISREYPPRRSEASETAAGGGGGIYTRVRRTTRAASTQIRLRALNKRLWIAAVFGALLVAWTIVVAVLPFLRFSVYAPAVRLPLETASVIAAALTSAVAYIRYSVRDDPVWLYVSIAFLVIALNQFAFGVVLAGNAATTQSSTYLWIGARLIAGIVLIVGARVQPEPAGRPTASRYLAVAVGVVAVLIALQATIWIAGSSLPPLVVPAANIATGSASLTAADVFLGSLGAAMFALAAYLFRGSPSIHDSTRTWLVSALVLASLSHLHYMLVPTIYTNRVSTGDVLRLAMSAVLLVGLVADVRRDAIDERRRAEELDAAYRLARERVKDLERIDRAKADVARMLAHELMHPIATVRALAVALEDGWGSFTDAQRRLALNGLVDQSDHLGALAASASEMGELRLDLFSHPERHPVRHLIASLERAHVGIGDRVHVERDPEAEAEIIAVDVHRMLQVFHNLVSNALKFTPPDTPIDIRMEIRDGFAIFTVRDLGPGIAASEGERVFERFTRGREAAAVGVDGQGLGLYISRLIVEAHGGRIWIEPTDGRGATFAFSVPVVASDA